MKKKMSNAEWNKSIADFNTQIAKNKAFFEKYEERRNRRLAEEIINSKDVEEE